MIRWSMIERAVNNKTLKEEIHELVISAMSEIGVNWSSEAQRTSFVELIDEYIADEFVQTGRIEQWDVRCDARNNKTADIANGRYFLDVEYRQRHCLNVTKLHYVIEDDGMLDLDYDIQF